MRRRARIGAAAIRRDSFRLMREPVAAGVFLSENPNAGKRGAARLAYMDGFVADLAAAQSAAYSPLRVFEQGRDAIGRRNPRMRPSRGYTV